MRLVSAIKSLLSIGLLLVSSLHVHAQNATDADFDAMKQAFQRPEFVQFPEHAPYSPQLATLGKMLFFDPRLSGAQNMSCATCHNPSFGWETPVEKAIGAMNVALDRHAPTTLNLAEAEMLFWDGRAGSLEEQARGPITHPKEMNANFTDLVARLEQIDHYNYWFNQLFPGEGLTEKNILTAIATYERTIVSGWTSFDEWVAGDEDAISSSAKRGFSLFVGKAACANCHSGWNFTDHQLHDIGIPTEDLGAFNVNEADASLKYAFKTPSLRNITLRAPYMHNGAMHDLRDVLQHYSFGGMQRQSRSNLMPDTAFEDQEISDLMAFLETLTEPDPNIETPALPSQ